MNQELNQAILAGDLPVIERLIAAGADINFKDSSQYDTTPLHLVVYYCRNDMGVVKDIPLAMAERLIAAGADVTATTSEGDTPLHWAALGGHTTMAQCLIKAGAQVNTQNHYGDTPLQLASDRQHAAMVEILQSALIADYPDPPTAPAP